MLYDQSLHNVHLLRPGKAVGPELTFCIYMTRQGKRYRQSFHSLHLL